MEENIYKWVSSRNVLNVVWGREFSKSRFGGKKSKSHVKYITNKIKMQMPNWKKKH